MGSKVRQIRRRISPPKPNNEPRSRAVLPSSSVSVWLSQNEDVLLTPFERGVLESEVQLTVTADQRDGLSALVRKAFGRTNA